MLQYVTYDAAGALTGAYWQALLPEHQDRHIVVTPVQYLGWNSLRANEARDGLEAVPPAGPVLADLQAAAVAAVNEEYDRRVLVLSSGYPAAERESWPVQTAEARALRADAGAATPWIDAAAAARGVARADLAARIVALDDQYRAVHGGLSGTRQRLEGEILAAKTADAVAAVAWPPEPVA